MFLLTWDKGIFFCLDLSVGSRGILSNMHVEQLYRRWCYIAKKIKLFFSLSFCSNILSSFLSRNAYVYIFFPTLLLCRAAQRANLIKEWGNPEGGKRKIITALGWLSELEDLTLARFHHKINNLKWHAVYPAVYKQLLLKITPVYFFSFTHVSGRKICLGVAHCGSHNI